uniref:Uncharacterized protein n=1 Tax=Rousettus aegyptiacus TaxID=9407 RepID=A0A7J8BFC4_ROUAE|nr:hypothetical protein HJG63_009808 [Rousettus aegyptiacus]
MCAFRDLASQLWGRPPYHLAAELVVAPDPCYSCFFTINNDSSELPAGRALLHAASALTDELHVGMSRLAFEVIRNEGCLRRNGSLQKQSQTRNKPDVHQLMNERWRRVPAEDAAAPKDPRTEHTLRDGSTSEI